MDNSTNKNRNNLLIEIEDQAFHLRTFLEQNSSRGLNLYHINRFLITLFSCFNPLLVEANFTEFFPVYLRLLKSFDPTGQKINASRKILKNAIKLYRNPGDVFRRKALGSCIKNLKQQIIIIESALEGRASRNRPPCRNPVRLRRPTRSPPASRADRHRASDSRPVG